MPSQPLDTDCDLIRRGLGALLSESLIVPSAGEKAIIKAIATLMASDTAVSVTSGMSVEMAREVLQRSQ